MKKRIAVLALAVSFLFMLTLPAAFAAEEAEGNNYNVLVINFDPVIRAAGNLKQHELNVGWNDPRWLADEYAADMAEISHGYVNYTVVDWIDLDEMPMTTDGLAYDPEEYYDTYVKACENTDGAYWQDSSWYDWGFSFDYDYYMERFQVYEKVNSGEVDEVWIFAGPVIGVTLYESQMIGKDAYWCNSPGLEKDCRPFVVYGFNYERGVGEMLEDAGHRAESIFNQEYGWPDYNKPYEEYTDWEKFSVYDLLSSGNAGVGNIHFAPNSVSDYDWGNLTYVYSDFEDWEDYPVMTMDPKLVNADEWGNGDIRLHHKWWFSLLPHADGVNEETGKYNNWWIYFTLTPEDGWNTYGGYRFYYQDGKPVTEWLYDQNCWYYFDANGAMMTGWVNDGGHKYYMDSDGKMTTGWLPENGNWYYLDENGVMFTGWLQSGDTWYLMRTTGEMVTGWYNYHGDWFYFDASGAMATGWQNINGNWYYLNSSGAMVTGWQYINGTWYYFGSSGAMATGWQCINGIWYCFDNDGAMMTGWQCINGIWYCFGNDGAMMTGWLQTNGQWYYFNGNGAMVTGWQEINGQWEMFSDSGAWLCTWDGN